MNYRIDTDTWFIFCILFIGALALFVFAHIAIPYLTRRRHSKRRKVKYALQDKISRQLEGKYAEHRIEALEKTIKS